MHNLIFIINNYNPKDMKILKKGTQDAAVVTLKKELARLGYQTDATTLFDEATRTTVIDFQKKQGLSADGIVGYNSWEKLFFANRPAGAKLSEEDFSLAARLLDCETAAMKAVQEVETGGRGGFFAAGKPAILFEGHIFWKQLKQRGISPEKYAAAYPDIVYPKWNKKHYIGGVAEYSRLEKARKINVDAANASASWGMFQIMGFNHALCEQKDVATFVKAMCASERSQLLLFCRFVRHSAPLHQALKAKNWVAFARQYNGSAYAENQYDRKLAKAYSVHSVK